MNQHLETDDGAVAHLLDASLAEVLGGREAPDVAAEVMARLQAGAGSVPQRSRSRALLAAAMVLLGLAAVCGVALLRPTDQVEAQEPDCDQLRPDFYPAMFGAQRILPPDARYLILTVALDPELAGRIAGLHKLRRLRLSGDKPPADEALATIAQLPELEDLTLVLPTPGGITSLLPAPKLRAVTIVGSTTRLDDALAAALVGLPRLRTLRLEAVELTRTGFRKLADAPHLETLGIDQVRGCSLEVLQQLKGFMSLRRLELNRLGRTPLVPETVKKPQDPESCGLTDAVARALAPLPLFEDLFLESTELTDEAIQELPLRLRRLSLVRCPDLTPAQLRSLRRLVRLEALHLDRVDERWCPDVHRGFPRPPLGPAERWQAQADLLRALPLREVTYDWFQPPDEVITALADLPHLQALVLHRVAAVQPWQPEDGDLRFVPRLRHLERLRLVDFQGTIDDLAVLRDVRTLRDLDVGAMPRAALRGQPLQDRLAKDLPGVRVRVVQQ